MYTYINIIFYLKKTSKNSDRRGIYANITFRSIQRQALTKIYANHPDHFQRGGNYNQGTPLGHGQFFYEHGGLAGGYISLGVGVRNVTIIDLKQAILLLL